MLVDDTCFAVKNRDDDIREHSYHIPTRQRTQGRTRPSSKYTAQQIPTKRRTPNMTKPSSKYNLPSTIKIEDGQNSPTKEIPASDKQGETMKKYPPGYYSREQHAIRLAKSTKFLKATGHTNYVDALAAAKEKLRLKKSNENRKRRQTEKDLGIKPKNYHTFYTRAKEGIILRKTVKILEEKNNTFQHKEARKEATAWYRNREKERQKRRKAAKAKRGGLNE